MTLGVLFGGPTPEHDISILTGLLAVRELQHAGRETTGIYWSKTGAFYSVPGDVEAESFLDGVPKGSNELTLRLGDAGGFYSAARLGKDRALVFEALVMATHGGPGEDGTIQGALDVAGVPYTGPTLAGAALGMDKWAFGAVMASAGVPTLTRALIEPSTTRLDFDGPYILKPRFGGSSIGIEVVTDVATATARLNANVHFARGCVVEPFRRDLVDLQIAVRTYPTLSLSAIERPIRRSIDAEILDYRDKYVGGEGMVSAPRELPAVLPKGQAKRIEEYARQVVELASVRGVARIDFLANESELYVNEINTIPGSLSKHLFVDPPLAFAALLGDLVAEAIERPAHRFSVAGADGQVLRKATAIASKLA